MQTNQPSQSMRMRPIPLKLSGGKSQYSIPKGRTRGIVDEKKLLVEDLLYVDDEEVALERYNREVMARRFLDFFSEIIALPKCVKGEKITIGHKTVLVTEKFDSPVIVLIDRRTGEEYKYGLVNPVDETDNTWYAQFIKISKTHSDGVYNFTEGAGSCSKAEFLEGTDSKIIPVSQRLLYDIDRFENTVRGLLWSKN